jgi:hypothetical protein
MASTVLSGSPLQAHDGPHEDGKPTRVTRPAPEHHQGHGATIEIPATQPLPTVRLNLVPDAKRGWNLEVKVTNFRFAPERVNTPGPTTEGHAHLMIDGQKVTRLYGAWYHLSGLQPGKRTIEVTLNTNQHEALMHKGQPIRAMTTIEVPALR